VQFEQITEDQYIELMEASCSVEHLDLGTTVMSKILCDDREIVVVSNASGKYAKVFH
jgi:hypothetical protein